MKTHKKKQFRLRNKYRFQRLKNHLRMFFCPSTTILFCVYTCLLLIFLCLTLAFFLRSYLTVELLSIFTLKDLLFAMITGVTASALVSICVEGASNYRENCRRYIILSDYLSVIFHYELEIRTYLKVLEKDTEIQEKPDRLQAVSHQLPKLIPILQNAIENKREFLSLKEAFEVQNILNTYEHYESIVYQHLLQRMKPIRGTKRPKNMSKRAWDSMPESWQVHLSTEEHFAEIRQLAQRLCQLGITGFENAEIPVGTAYLVHENQTEEDFYEESIGEEEAAGEEGESIWDEYDDCDITAMEMLLVRFESEMLSSFCLEIDQSMGRLLILAKHQPGWGIYARIIEKTPTPLS